MVGGRPEAPQAVVRMRTDDAWRVFYNAEGSPGLLTRIQVDGDTVLSKPMLKARSVIL